MTTLRRRGREVIEQVNMHAILIKIVYSRVNKKGINFQMISHLLLVLQSCKKLFVKDCFDSSDYIILKSLINDATARGEGVKDYMTTLLKP